MAHAVVSFRTGPQGSGNVMGRFAFYQESFDSCTVISGQLSGFSPNTTLRIAIHAFGNLEMDPNTGKLTKLGNVFNPQSNKQQEQRVVGELGNVQVDTEGNAVFPSTENDIVKLIGPHSVFARSLVVYLDHSEEVLACGVIGIA